MTYGVTFLLFNGNEFSEAVIILLANNVALNKINLLNKFFGPACVYQNIDLTF